MSTTQQVLSNRHKQQHTDLSTTSATSVFTPGSNGAYLTALLIVNDAMDQTTASVSFYSTTTNAPMWESKNVAGFSELTLTFPAPFHVKDGEEIRVTAGHANRLHVWAFGTTQGGR